MHEQAPLRPKRHPLRRYGAPSGSKNGAPRNCSPSPMKMLDPPLCQISKNAVFISVRSLEMLNIAVLKMASTDKVFGLPVYISHAKNRIQVEIWRARCPGMVLKHIFWLFKILSFFTKIIGVKISVFFILGDRYLFSLWKIRDNHLKWLSRSFYYTNFLLYVPGLRSRS